MYPETVGFYLWLDGELAWAQGTYEYRPMGAAVIAASDLFRRRDFRPCPEGTQPPARRGAEFAGEFASIEHLNRELQRRRKAKSSKIRL